MADSILRLRVESQEYDNKLKRATDGLNRYVSECRKVGGTLEVVEKETLDYVRALGQMDTVSKTATGKMAEMKKTFTELAVQYRQLTNEEKNSPFGKALAQSLDQLKVRINDTKADLSSVTSELNGSKFGQFGSVIDTIGQKMGITGNLTEMLTSKTALMTAAIGAGAAAAGKAAEMWASYNSELAKQDQVVTVTTGLKDDDAERMTDAVRAIANTYNVDFREAVNAANTLMTQFGKTGDEAIQLLRDGMQGMIQGDGGKLLSMIQQYAPSFRDAGIEASQLVAIIQNSEGGLFTDQNMNAIVMGIKNIRLMTNATSEALQKIGIDSEEMTQKLNSGSMTIFDAMRQVSNAIENTGSSSQAAGEVMQQVFGRQGARAGTKVGEAIASLNTNLEETKTQTGDLGNAYRDLEIANENLNKAIRDCFEYDGWEVMKTEIETGLVNALSDVLNSCRSLYGMLEDIGALKVFEFISGSILQCIRPFRELYNYAKLLFDELGGGSDAPKPKAGVRNLADDPNVDDNGNYKVKNVKNKNNKRLVSKPGEPVRYEGSTAPVGTGANPVKPLKPRRTATSSGSRATDKKEQTEMQQNQKRINDLTQQYVTLMAAASKAGKPLTDEQQKQTSEIQRQISELEKRNGQLKLYQEQAKGKFLGSGVFKQQMEVDVAANNKKIEELEKQLISLDGVTIDPKTVTITATDEAMPRLREIQGITIDDKTVAITADDKTQPEFREVEGIRLKGKKVTVTADTMEAMRAVQGINGITVNSKKVTVTADTQEALQALQGIEGVTVDTKTVKVTAETDEARQKVEELKRQIAELKDQNIMITAAMGSIGMPLSETPRMGVTDVTYGKGKNQFVPAPLMPTMDDVVRQRGGNLLDEKAMKAVNNDLYGDKGDKSDKNTTKSLLNGISQLTDGLEKIGIDVPDEIQAVIGVIQGVMQVIEAVNAIIGVTQTTALAANTAAMVSLEAALWANTASSFGFFSNGGIVPKFADGGLVGRAALGIAIPGNSMSGDNLRLPVDGGRGVIGVNSGEVILNRAQQGVIASALDGGGAQSMHLDAVISGEQIRLVLNNNGRRTGRGEYVQSTRRR
jgi:hypothetical protein